MEQFQKRLDSTINKLVKLVSHCDTESIIGYIATSITGNETVDLISQTSLSSPLKQFLYLGGLTLSTEKSGKEIEVDEGTINKIKGLLEDVANCHSLLFYPDSEEEVTESWKTAREVSMPAFLTYFNTVLLN